MSKPMLPTIFILDDEAPARLRMRTLLSDIAGQCPTVVVGESGQPQAAFDAIAACKPDILLLDVQMPGISGIEFAQHLQKNTQNDTENASIPKVIFVSAHDVYAINAFEVHAFDYLLKPVRAERLQEAILRAVGKSNQLDKNDAPNNASVTQTQRQFFSVMERGRILLLAVKDILYIKAEQKYLTLRTADQSFLIEDSLSAIEQEMNTLFVRIHRNTLVARAALMGVERGMELDEQTGKMTEAWQVILRDCKERLPISRRLLPAVKALVK